MDHEHFTDAGPHGQGVQLELVEGETWREIFGKYPNFMEGSMRRLHSLWLGMFRVLHCFCSECYSFRRNWNTNLKGALSWLLKIKPTLRYAARQHTVNPLPAGDKLHSQDTSVQHDEAYECSRTCRGGRWLRWEKRDTLCWWRLSGRMICQI